ncbi:MAG: tetratricopeptide repeat protein [Ignavibacteria bacterium]|jgi:tetratricopeptide (TPR) repeat protein
MNVPRINEISASINKLLTGFIQQDKLNLIPAKPGFSFVELIDIAEKLIGNQYFDHAEKLLLLLSEIEVDPAILSRLAFCQKRLKKIDAAKKSYESALQLSRDSYLINYNYGIMLQEIGDYESAIEKYSVAIKLNPGLKEAYYNLGNIYRELDNYPKAKSCYQKCIEVDNKYENAYYNLGVIYEKLDDDESAEKSYNKAIELNENNIEAHWNKSLVLLKNKNLIEGFNEFEWRLRKKEFERTFPFPKWNGEDLRNKKIFVYCEQGFGDAIHFSRYLYNLLNIDSDVTLECRRELVDLFKTNFPGIEVVERGTLSYKEFDFYIPLLSLPRLFKLVFEMINGDSYLKANELKKNEWKKKLINNGKLNIGIAWAGNKNHQNDAKRSIEPTLFDPIIQNGNYNFYNLQIDTSYSNGKLIDFTNSFNSFDDTAAFVSNLDLVISVDTAVAHLAGALGIETWILLPYNSDWRWFKDIDKSPWYDSVELIRKNKNENRESAIKILQRKLSSKKRLELDADKRYEEINLLLKNNNYKKALEKIQNLLDKNETSEIALNYLGILYLKLKKYSKAEEYFQKVISINPGFSEAYSNLGIAYFEQKMYEEAVELQKKSVELNSNNADSFYNLAYSLQELGDIQTAMSNYNKAIRIKPGYANAWFNLSLLQLMTGNYKDGWRNYNKWIGKTGNIIKREFDTPRWLGEDLTGKTLLVYSDQAYGDAIQFARYLPLLKKYNYEIIFECPESLVYVLKKIPGVNNVVSSKVKQIQHDYNVALMKLPEISTWEKSIPEINYDISISESVYNLWHDKIVNRNKFKVAFVWSGNSFPEINRKRHMSIDDIAPLFKIKDVDFYSLQLGDDKKELNRYIDSENVHDITEDIKSFEDTAAIISQVDLVITIDTSVAHLAGTMEKNVWTMLALVPDWRWEINGAGSKWYPSMKLFRQKERGNWKDVINEVYNELKKQLT